MIDGGKGPPFSIPPQAIGSSRVLERVPSDDASGVDRGGQSMALGRRLELLVLTDSIIRTLY